MLSSLIDPLASLFYPQLCGGCGSLVERVSDGAACSECWKSTRLFLSTDRLCAKCGLFLTDNPAVMEISTCAGCLEHHYDSARAAGIYHLALAASVLHMKSVPTVPKRLKDILTATLDAMSLNGDHLIVPVPISKRRFHERGFNQAALLAAEVAKYLGQAMDDRTLVRENHTPMHRAAMDRKAREATVKNAFAVVRPNLVRGRNILLVDDLMTSGATASQCAKALKKKGAARVDVVTLARAD